MSASIVNPLQAKTKKRFHLELLAFLLPVLLLTLAYALQRVFPFGDRHILTVDLYHQYAPFLGELQRKMLNHENLFFTWSAGLGFNFLPLFAYYLASPLNLLLLILPRFLLSEAVLLITLLKVGLCGLCFYTFLKKTSHREGSIAVGFAVGYALSAYVLAYSWNIMWLDGVFLLPLVALSLFILVREGRVAPYIFALFLLLVSNYYIAFFACLALALYFVILLERFHKGRTLPQLILSSVKFLCSSLLSCGMALLLLLPTVLALQATSAAGDSFPGSFDTFAYYLDFLSRLLPFSTPSIRSGMPNIYAGVFVLLLAFVYLSSRRISRSRKIVNVAIIAFLIFSLNNNYLNYIWHGLHYPNQLPFRNSFVFVFFLLTMLYDAIPLLHEFSAKEYLRAVAGFALLLLILNKMDSERYQGTAVFVSICLLSFYALTFALARSRKIRNRQKYNRELAAIICFIMVVELGLNTIQTIEAIAKAEYFGLRDGYVTGEVAESLQNKVDELKTSPHNKDLLRAEVLPDRSVNDAMLYQSNGLTIFSSSFPKAPVRFLGNLGYPNNGINSFQYCGSTIVMDTLLGIDYLFKREVSKIEDKTRQKIDSGTAGLEIWHNEAALPPAFVASSSFSSDTAPAYQSPAMNPFKVQDAFAHHLSGSEEVYEHLPLAANNFAGGTYESRALDDSGYEFTLHRNGTEGAYFAVNIDCAEAGTYYFAWQMGEVKIDNVQLMLPNNEFVRLGNKNRNIAELGWHEAGSKLEVRLYLKNEDKHNSSERFKLFAVRLREDKYSDLLERMGGGRVDFTEFGSSSFKLVATAPPESCLFVTSTFDKGWQCTVNGERREILPYDECFMYVMLPEGKCELEFKFIPRGFKEGLIVSCLSLFIALGILIIERRRKKKLRAKQQVKTPVRQAEFMPLPEQKADLACKTENNEGEQNTDE